MLAIFCKVTHEQKADSEILQAGSSVVIWVVVSVEGFGLPGDLQVNLCASALDSTPGTARSPTRLTIQEPLAQTSG